MTKASDLFVQCLEAEDIRFIFGVPGEENADFMISLEESDSIRFVLTRQEQGAAFMAEIHGRLTGEPAGCLGTLGPGATNLMTGVGNANMDRAPMLVLTGQANTERLHKESHQVMDVVSMFRQVTKWAQTVYHPDNIPEIVRKAVRLASAEKPGATHIELPQDVAAADAISEPLRPSPVRQPVPDAQAVDQAWQAIRKATRPVILAGNGCIRGDATDELRKFVELTGIGAISTFMGKGSIDMDAEECCYTVGLGGKDYPASLVEQSDVVIAVGYDMVEYHPMRWNPKGDHVIIHIDTMLAEVDENYVTAAEVVGDIDAALAMLNERVKAFGPENLTFDLSAARETRAVMKAELEQHANDETQGKIKPQKAVWDARQVLGPNDILLTDVGTHKMWVARHYHCHEPNTCLVPNGFCSMGFALPGAIAASLVYPDRRVMGVAGDGAFLMNVQEMETAARLGVDNCTMFVWEDHEYGLIALKQWGEFGHHTDLRFGNPDWLMLADSFGWNGFRCENSADLLDTLEKSYQVKGPSLVVIPIDYAESRDLKQRLGGIDVVL